MQWVRSFDFFLFDFDGLLVNTEHLHYAAYVNMMAGRGYKLDWSFSQFCQAAHLNSTAIREGIYADFPDLDPDWQTLYNEKKKNYFELIGAGKVELMPGVEKLLLELEKQKIPCCVVTNSFLEQMKLIRSQLKVLNTIPHWITREDYEKPKPSPESYFLAIELYAKPGDRIIGFEDSIRGLHALKETPALPVLICDSHHPLLEMLGEGTLHFESLEQIPDNFAYYQP
jgi:HAD superfamily hydrolase (TIGR01509 family)